MPALEEQADNLNPKAIDLLDPTAWVYFSTELYWLYGVVDVMDRKLAAGKEVPAAAEQQHVTVRCYLLVILCSINSRAKCVTLKQKLLLATEAEEGTGEEAGLEGAGCGQSQR